MLCLCMSLNILLGFCLFLLGFSTPFFLASFILGFLAFLLLRAGGHWLGLGWLLVGGLARGGLGDMLEITCCVCVVW